MYVDPITQQPYDYATPITCDNNPRTIIELDPDSDDQDFYILRLEPIKRKPPLIFTISQIETTIRRNKFTAQDGGIFSNAELDQFLNRIFFSKHCDTTLQLLGKTLSYSFNPANSPDYSDSYISQTNPYNTLRIELHDKLLNLPHFFNTYMVFWCFYLIIWIVTAACLYPALRLDKLYAALIRCLVLWTVTKQILVFLF